MTEQYEPSLTEDQREAVLDWMELPTKPQVYEAVARMIAQVRAETWDEAIRAVFAWWSAPEDARGVIVNPYGVHPADRLMQDIEKEADQ